MQVVEEIFDLHAAKKMGIDRKGQVCFMVHCGSRGLGHQVATGKNRCKPYIPAGKCGSIICSQEPQTMVRILVKTFEKSYKFFRRAGCHGEGYEARQD